MADKIKIEMSKPGCGCCGDTDAAWRGDTLRVFLCDRCHKARTPTRSA